MYHDRWTVDAHSAEAIHGHLCDGWDLVLFGDPVRLAIGVKFYQESPRRLCEEALRG